MPSENYQKCRARFLEAKDRGSSQILRNSLSDAIAHADVCAEIFMEFTPALKTYGERIKTDYEKTMENCSTERKERIQEQMRTAEQSGDMNRLRELIQQSKQQECELEVATAEVKRSQSIEDFYRGRMGELFEKVYAPDDSSRSIGAVLELVDFLIDLIPISHAVSVAVSAYQKIRNILMRQRTEVANAEKYMVEIESFLEASYLWALVSLHFTSNLNAVNASKETTLNQAAADIEKRLVQKKAPMIWRPPAI